MEGERNHVSEPFRQCGLLVFLGYESRSVRCGWNCYLRGDKRNLPIARTLWIYRTLWKEGAIMWRVVIWTSPDKGDSTERDTKEAAYRWANKHTGQMVYKHGRVICNTYAIEIYGPNGFYDGVQ
jgi:hypothetical protein